MGSFNLASALQSGTASSASSPADEIVLGDKYRDGVMIHNKDSVYDLHVALYPATDTATKSDAAVSADRLYVIPPGFTLSIEAMGETRVCIACAAGTPAWNAREFDS